VSAWIISKNLQHLPRQAVLLRMHRLRAWACVRPLQRMAHPALQPMALHRASRLMMLWADLLAFLPRRVRENVRILSYSPMTSHHHRTYGILQHMSIPTFSLVVTIMTASIHTGRLLLVAAAPVHTSRYKHKVQIHSAIAGSRYSALVRV